MTARAFELNPRDVSRFKVEGFGRIELPVAHLDLMEVGGPDRVRYLDDGESPPATLRAARHLWFHDVTGAASRRALWTSVVRPDFGDLHGCHGFAPHVSHRFG